MPLGQTITSPGTAAGMTLRAWCLFSAAGTLQKGSANVSSITKTGTGTYQINLAAAMPDALVYMDIRPIWTSGASPGTAGLQSAQFPNVSTPSVGVFAGGAATDLGCYVGIYG